MLKENLTAAVQFIGSSRIQSRKPVTEQTFVWGVFGKGGFWQGGFLSRGFLSGGLCPGGFLSQNPTFHTWGDLQSERVNNFLTVCKCS